MRAKMKYICKKFINHQIKKCLLFRCRHAVVKAWFHRRIFSAKCELFRLFLLNCDHSNKLFLLDCSQFKRNRRNISHFDEKKRPWNQAFIMQTLNWINQCPLFMTVRHIFEISEDDHPLNHSVFTSFHLPNWHFLIWSISKVVSFWIFSLIWLGLEVRVRG
jgi:hypothetical protein